MAEGEVEGLARLEREGDAAQLRSHGVGAAGLRVHRHEALRPREALESFGADALLSKRLVTIHTDLPVELDLESLCIEKPDRKALRELFLDLEFHTLIRDFAPDEEEKAATAADRMPTDYRLADTAEAVRDVVRRAREQGFVSVDT